MIVPRSSPAGQLGPTATIGGDGLFPVVDAGRMVVTGSFLFVRTLTVLADLSRLTASERGAPPPTEPLIKTLWLRGTDSSSVDERSSLHLIVSGDRSRFMIV